jgi:hypothetical protein
MGQDVGEPKYITELKDRFGLLDKNVTAKFAAIDTTLQILPKIESHLKEINDSVAANKQEIALVKQKQDDCPARAAHKSNPDKPEQGALSFAKWGLKEFGVFGALLGIIALLIVLMLAQTGFFSFLA